MRFLNRAEVLEKTGVSYQTIWAWMRDGKFPRSRELAITERKISKRSTADRPRQRRSEQTNTNNQTGTGSRARTTWRQGRCNGRVQTSRSQGHRRTRLNGLSRVDPARTQS
ncbi:AlpA family phage regulatory protein [Bradyrhizobium japonicum]|uniref:helix-turn-helix transcriptional regulator n=1 Tax=Bradyrhizobium japonicum TaxID=375 RepID=UPI001BA9FE38|nr:AlpA family phage regulatory protein [Bradyrhizobium japonicum]